MAPADANPRPALVARSSSSPMSPGAIAGAVVGSVLGGALVLLVLGFFYFRHRRRSLELRQQDSPSSKAHTRRVSFPAQDSSPGESTFSAGGRPPSIRDGTTRDAPGPGDGTGFPSLSFPGGTEALPGNEAYVHSALQQQQGLAQDSGPSMPRAPPGPSTEGPADVASPVAASASYYDTTIAMDSDPEDTPMAPPSRQMTDMYKEQLRLTRESKRQSSKGSVMSRIMKTIKRKRLSDGASAGDSPSIRSTSRSQADVPISSVEGPSAWSGPGQDQWGPPFPQGPAGSGMFEEPQQMGDGVDSDQHQNKKSRYPRTSQDTIRATPDRLDSLQTALQRQPTNVDPDLPSSALGGELESPFDGPGAHYRQRMLSPEIPEPMEAERWGMAGDPGRSELSNSGSPPPQPGDYVNPMTFMKPSTETEMAAFNNAASLDPELIRKSGSPDTSYEPAPEEQQAQDVNEDQDMVYIDDDEDEMDTDTDIPPADDATQIGAASDYSTPLEQTSTNPSSSRTPDTRITASQSPVPDSIPDAIIKSESSASPEASTSLSPRLALVCEECGRSFDQVHKLNHHKRYHDRKHECPYDGCDKKFGTKTHLDRHINDKHEKKKGYHCTEPSCPYFHGGKAFPRKDNWRRHMQNKHGLSPQNEPDAIAT